MNTGVITSRYAKALLRYTQETGHGEQVCAQVQALLASPDKAPDVLEPDLERFIALLVERGRMEYVRQIFQTFVRMYYKAENIRVAHLTTAIPAPELEQKLLSMLEKQTGSKVILDTTVDPALIGGFVVEVDDYMMDASVRRQLETIRRQFIISNNRIV